MIKFKVILSIFILILSGYFLEAQKRISYYDVYEIIKESDHDKAYTLLLAVQKQDPDFANAYFQLGMIAKAWTMEFNPFTEFEYTKLFIYNTKLYFNLAKLKIKDDKKKNIEFFLNASIKFEGKKLTFEEISSFIDQKVSEIKEYEDNITKIIKYFNLSSDKYNECVNIFMQINSEYTKINNIYLTEDEDFLNQMNMLETNFDSTLFYFKKYKESLVKYPLKGYNQNYRLNDIITYRLDGLTNSNFLNNNILLWDYKKWVQTVKKTKEEKVSDNRKEIYERDEKMQNQINQLLTKNYSDIYKLYKLDDKFVYKIEKYDNNSLLIKLFKLNEAKINYLTAYRKVINNPLNVYKYSLSSKSLHCNNLLEKKFITDSLNSKFKLGINAGQVKKYQKFYSSKYKGLEGLTVYSKNQKNLILKKQNTAFENLKKKLYINTYHNQNDSVLYGKQQIDIKRHYPDINIQTKGKYYITDFKTRKDSSNCFSGFYKDKTGKIGGFSGVSKDFNKLRFFKKTISDTAHILHLLIEPFPGGCFTMETSMSNSISNTLIKFSDKGKVLQKKKIPFNKIPRFMKYDDINNSIIIVFNGMNLDQTNENNDDEQIIYHMNLDDELKTYVIRMPAKSYIFDIIKMDKRIFVFSNYIYFVKNDGTKSWSLAGKNVYDTNILVSIISLNGIIEKQVSINYDQAFFGAKAIKLNSNKINVLGFKTQYLNKGYNKLKDKELYYLLIDSDAKEIYSSWHD